MPFTSAELGRHDFAAYVLEHVSEAAVLLASGTRRIDITGAQAHVPRILNDGSATWVAEGQEIPSDAPDANEMVLVPKAVKNVVTLSNESIEDVEADVLESVGDALTRSVARALDLKAFSADAATAITPPGLLDLLSGVGSTGTVDVATIRARIAALMGVGANPNAVYVHSDDYQALDAETDNSGRGLLVPDPTQPGAQMLGGARLYVAPLPAAGTAIIAEAQQIVVGVRKDASVEASPHARFTADSMVVRVVGRFDLDVNDPAGIDVIRPA